MKTKRILITIIIILLLIHFSRQINDYAVEFMANQQEKDENGLIIGAYPYKMDRNPDTTILLVHGFTSSPKDFKDMAYYLSEKNISVNAILLPGHGTTPKDLKNIKYQSWTSKLNNEIEKINSKNKFVLGYSLGGTLALDLAEDEELNGIITINAPIFLEKSRYLPFVPLLKTVETYHVAPPESIIVAINKDRITYGAFPLSAISELLNLVEQLNPNSVTEPALIIQTKNDTIVNPESANYIYNHISSKDKELIWLTESTHENPHKQEQEEIFEEIYKFIQKNSKLL
ncbi:MAG: alpha/beta fold hydrolase [Nanoarchaeota archaeon]|nr:alpha/beta fold hydrolase [Nanoarchaeota archaeon]